MRDGTVKQLSRLHTLMFRLSGGRAGRRLVDNVMALLTTTGARTGQDHTVPLLLLEDGDSWIVIASYGGRPDHPQWYRNLLENPAATLQVGTSKTAVIAHTLDEADRSVWWPKIVQAYDGYAEYASRTDRQIPVVRLIRHS